MASEEDLEPEQPSGERPSVVWREDHFVELVGEDSEESDSLDVDQAGVEIRHRWRG